MQQSNNIEQLRMDRARKRVKSIMGFYKHLAAYVVVNSILLAIKWFTMDKGEVFWEFSTFSTVLFWGIGLAFHAFGVFGTNAFLGSD